MAKFEVVSKFKGEEDLLLPERKTKYSAGYDLTVAEDIFIPAYQDLSEILLNHSNKREDTFLTLKEMQEYTKKCAARPTLVSTGVKCKLEEGTYLELSVRSSTPLKYWLIMGNSVGIIDGDYYNNPDNEGEIFFQLINLSPYDIKIQKGEAIGQGIIKPYLTTEDDVACGQRTGGFGSTTK